MPYHLTTFDPSGHRLHTRNMDDWAEVREFVRDHLRAHRGGSVHITNEQKKLDVRVTDPNDSRLHETLSEKIGSAAARVIVWLLLLALAIALLAFFEAKLPAMIVTAVAAMGVLVLLTKWGRI